MSAKVIDATGILAHAILQLLHDKAIDEETIRKLLIFANEEPEPVKSTRRIAPEWRGAEWSAFARGTAVLKELFIHAAFVRDLSIEFIGESYFLITDGQREVSFWLAQPETVTLVARHIAHSKQLSKVLLSRADVRVPQGKLLQRNKRLSALEYAKRIGFPVVVKPDFGSGGEGVTAGIADDAAFSFAWKAARKAAPDADIVVEKHIPGRDFRLLVVGGELVATSLRVPATIEGDGTTTIEGLFEKRNEARQSNPYLAGKPFAMTPQMERNLRESGMSLATVLGAGQELQLDTVANTGRGECIDVTEEVHPGFYPIAARAARVLPRAIHVGIDLIASDISLAPEAQEWGVCEINTTPGLGMHHFPIAGKPRDTAGLVIELLFPGRRICPRSEFRSVRTVLTGAVISPNFHRWLWKRANIRGLGGWVRNIEDGRAEAVFAGPPRAVESMLSQCRRGLPPSTVAALDVEDFTGATPPNFEVCTGEEVSAPLF
jgi:D-alanine-D-alanine ligase-like ATP-grasp enzyme/acylphosphatase